MNGENMKITIYDGSKPPYDLDLNKFNKDVVSFGRQTDSDIVFFSQRVSRVHGCFFLENGEWYVHDLESTNGIILNGKPIKDSVLSLNDKLCLFQSSNDGVFMVVKDMGVRPPSEMKTINMASSTAGNASVSHNDMPYSDSSNNPYINSQYNNPYNNNPYNNLSNYSSNYSGNSQGLGVNAPNRVINKKKRFTLTGKEILWVTFAVLVHYFALYQIRGIIKAADRYMKLAIGIETSEETTEAATVKMSANYDDIYADVIKEYEILTHNPNSIEPDVYPADETEMTIHDKYIYDGKVEINDSINYENTTYGYAFYDIDNNGVKEMIISKMHNNKIYAIYTYYDGNVYGLTGGDWQEDIYIYEDGLILVDRYGGPGYQYQDYMYINNDKLEAKGLLYLIDNDVYCKDHDINQEYYMDGDYMDKRKDELDLADGIYFEFYKSDYKYEEVKLSYTDF